MFLVRHGRTVWNKEQIFRGHRDVPLDEVGKDQARLAASRLRNEPIDAIYSSPLSRAYQTAEAIAQPHGLDVRVDERFTDLHFGIWEGKRRSDVAQQYPDLYDQWLHEPHRVAFPGGDTLDVVAARALQALGTLVNRHPGGTIAIVSHRVVLKVVICSLLGLDTSHFWNIRQDATAVNCFDLEDSRWIATLVNDVCHLVAQERPSDSPDF
jgi:broad specificity phosphatase PhoE